MNAERIAALEAKVATLRAALEHAREEIHAAYGEHDASIDEALAGADGDLYVSQLAEAQAGASVMREAGHSLLESLGEYVRQSMHGNPEWRAGIVAIERALASDVGRALPERVRLLEAVRISRVSAGPRDMFGDRVYAYHDSHGESGWHLGVRDIHDGMVARIERLGDVTLEVALARVVAVSAALVALDALDKAGGR